MPYTHILKQVVDNMGNLICCKRKREEVLNPDDQVGYKLCVTTKSACYVLSELKDNMSHGDVMAIVNRNFPTPSVNVKWSLVRGERKTDDSDTSYRLWRSSDWVNLKEAAGDNKTIYVWPEDALAIRVITEDTNKLLVILFWASGFFENIESTWAKMSAKIVDNLPVQFISQAEQQSKAWWNKLLDYINVVINLLLSNQLTLDTANRDKLDRYLKQQVPEEVYPHIDVRVKKSLFGLLDISSDQATKWLQLVGITTVTVVAGAGLESVTGIAILNPFGNV